MSEFTVEQVLARMNTLGRAVPVLDEILSILHDNLPPVLVELGLPAIRTWDYAGVEVKNWPAVLVGDAIRVEVVGTGFKDVHALAAICAYAAPQITRRQFQDALDTAQVMRGLLTMPTVMGPRYTEDGALLWSYMLQDGLSPVPQNFPHFRGWQAEFHIEQYPMQTDLWPVPEEPEP